MSCLPASNGVMWLTGLSSLIPYPWTTRQSSRSATARPRSASSGAAPDMTTFSDDRSCSSTSGCLASATATGGAMNAMVHRWRAMVARNSARSNRAMMTSRARACSAALSNTVMP